MSPRTVRFYFGLGSRYSYLAATQLERLERVADAQFDWFPLQSGELIKRANAGRSPFLGDLLSGQYDWSYRRRDAEAWAALYGIPYHEPARLEVDPADLAKACWAAKAEGKLRAMSWRLFQAIFVEGLVISRAVLCNLASEIGLSGSDLVASLKQPTIAAQHEAAIDDALKDGAFGVPTFVFEGQLFWGNDRLLLLEHALLMHRE